MSITKTIIWAVTVILLFFSAFQDIDEIIKAYKVKNINTQSTDKNTTGNEKSG